MSTAWKIAMVGLCALCATANRTQAQQNQDAGYWSRFRGPEGYGVVDSHPVTWPWNPDRIVKVPLPGSGIGSPVVWGDFAFLISSSPDDATRYAIAVDLKTNTIIWQRSYESQTHRLHAFSSYASTTPAVDATGVIFAWGDPEHVIVKKLSHTGDEVWTRDLGRYVSQHGFGTSPLLVDGLVVLLNSQDAEELEPGLEPGEDRMVALDSNTGTTVWETPLPTKRVCYGVPAVRAKNGRTELVCATTGQGIFGIDAKTGQILWHHDCFKLRVCASTLLVGDLAIASHGSMGGRDNLLVAYDIEKQQERFRIQRAAPYVPTPIAKGGHLFLWSDSGIVSCVRLGDGSVCWSERIGGNFFGSPIIVGNVLINVSDVGQVTALSASEGFQKLGTLDTGAMVRSTLAATSSSLLLRTDDALWVIQP